MNLLVNTGVAFAALIVLWAVTVTLVRERRGVLLWVGLGVFLLAAVLFGGAFLLERFGLAWRQWVTVTLAVLLWLDGLAAAVLTVCFVPKAIPSAKGFARAIAAICLVIAMFGGTLYGGLWIYSGEESVIEYQGEKAVMCEEHFLDYICRIYEYHGPFVRGADPIGPIGG